MNAKSKEEIENTVSKAMIKFFEEHMGEKTNYITTLVIENTIIFKISGVLPPAERQMCKNQKGLKLLDGLKNKLLEKSRPLLKSMIHYLTGLEVTDIHTNFNCQTGEHFEFYILSKDIEFDKKVPLCRKK